MRMSCENSIVASDADPIKHHVIQVSATLQGLLDKLADAVASTTELVQQIRIQAESEGLTFEETRELVIAALKKRQLADRTIRKYLPLELKNTNMARVPKIAAPHAANITPTVEQSEIHTNADVMTAGPAVDSATVIDQEKDKQIADLANQLADKTSEISRQNADIEALKQEKKVLEEQIAQASIKPASELVENPQEMKKRIQDQAKLLLPFEAKVEFEIRGQILPLIVKVQPVTKSVTVKLDEVAARRLAQA